MKGILKKTKAGWFVWYQVMKDEITSGYDSLPLHPDNEESLIEGNEVEFEIVMDEPEHRYSHTPYAKIINEDKIIYEDKGTWVNYDESWEDIEEDYLKDNYPVFGGPFTNALTPFEWLKQYFNSPKRKK